MQCNIPENTTGSSYKLISNILIYFGWWKIGYKLHITEKL